MEKDNLNILLIEDDNNHLELLERSIKYKNDSCIIESADNVSNAKIILETFRPDVVICDWLLPDGYGTDILKLNVSAEFPTIIMTSYGNESVAVDAIKNGALDYIIKSTDSIDNIYHIIKRSIREWNLIQEKKQTEKILIEYQKKIEKLYKLTSQLSSIDSEKELYDFICLTLFELIPNSIVFINKVDWQTRESKNISSLGFNELKNSFKSILPVDLENLTFKINDASYNEMLSAKLIKINGGFYEYTFKYFPSQSSRLIEQIIGIKEIYGIGIVRNNVLYGNASIIIRNDSQVIDKSFIETFINQAAILVQRKNAENELKNLNKELSEQRDKFKTLSSEYYLLNEELTYKNYALKSSEEKYRSLIETMNEGLITSDNDGIIQYVNKRAYQILGYSSEDLIGKNGYEFAIHPDDRGVINYKDNMRLSNLADDYQVRMIKKNGEVIWVLMSGSPIYSKENKVIGSIGIFTDITEKYKTELELKKHNAFIESLILNIPFEFWVIDKNNEIVIQSDYCMKNWGHSIGKNLNKSVFFADDIDNWNYKIQKALLGETVSYDKEMYYGGNLKYFHIIVSPIIMETENWGVLIINLDITDRKQKEKELTIAKENAENVSKTQKDILGNLNQEIRTPLNSIIAFTNLLLINTNFSIEQLEFLNLINSSSKKLYNILESIFDFSLIGEKSDNIKFEKFNLKYFVDNTISNLNSIIEHKSITINCVISDDCSYFYGDKSSIEQIILHLLINAIKFTNSGSIEIKIYKDNQLNICISDTGSGIPRDKISEIFNPFYLIEEPTKRRFQGIGIGLSIVRGIVKQLNGTINVQSKLGEGSIFDVSIPITNDENVENENNQSIDNFQNFKELDKKFKILIVDDDSINLTYMKKFLIQYCFDIDETADGDTALKLYFNNDYDIILLDINLPVMSGYEITSIIRESEANIGNHIPIIAMTAYPEKDDNKTTLSLGMDDFLTKPIDNLALLKILSKYLK